MKKEKKLSSKELKEHWLDTVKVVPVESKQEPFWPDFTEIAEPEEIATNDLGIKKAPAWSVGTNDAETEGSVGASVSYIVGKNGILKPLPIKSSQSSWNFKTDLNTVGNHANYVAKFDKTAGLTMQESAETAILGQKGWDMLYKLNQNLSHIQKTYAKLAVKEAHKIFGDAMFTNPIIRVAIRSYLEDMNYKIVLELEHQDAALKGKK